MAKIKMLVTMPGSMDGVSANLYIAGREYNIDDQEINQALADIFINANWAMLVRTRKMPAPSEMTVEKSAPEIKDPPEPEILTEEEADREETFEEGAKDEVVSEAKSTRVYELADELGVPWADIVKSANEFGIDIKAAQAGLTKSEVKKIKANFKK